MNNRREEFNRFSVSLKAELRKLNNENACGEVRDFSRNGLKLAFDEFDYGINSNIDLKIEEPTTKSLVPARGRVAWKRNVQGKFEVGIELTDLPQDERAEILDRAYKDWRRKNFPA